MTPRDGSGERVDGNGVRVHPGGMTRYTVHRIADRYEIRDEHTQEPLQLSFDSADAARSCALLANAVEEATVAHLEDWLAA